MKKYIMFLALPIIIVIIVAIVLIVNPDKDIKEKKVEYNYFILLENEKFGVIDKSGNVLIKAEYDDVAIPNPEKDIFICTNYDDDKTNIIVLNKENNRLFKDYDSVNRYFD